MLRLLRKLPRPYKGGMNKGDHSVAWSRHKTWLKGQGKEAQDKYNGLSKTKKGEAVALWLVKSQGPKFQAWTEDVKATKSLEKSKKWKSEKQMLEEHSWEDFQAHLQSGRIRRREDPWTYGVYNYMDNGDATKRSKVAEGQKYQRGQEYAPDEKDEQC